MLSSQHVEYITDYDLKARHDGQKWFHQSSKSEPFADGISQSGHKYLMWHRLQPVSYKMLE